MAQRKKPLTLSIIIPVYNERRYLRSCLQAIASQIEPPDEVIVVDNNSSDGSVDIAREFSFVRVVREKTQGIVYARNTGFDSCKSDIIGRIDADTILPPDWTMRIKEFYGKSSNSNCALTGGGYFYNVRFRWLSGWLQSQIAYRFNRLIMGHYILWGSNMAITSADWRRVRDKVCLDNDIHEDLDLAVHLHNMGVEITYFAHLKVGVTMRRLNDHTKLKENLMLWPRTLKRHDKKSWVFGWLGARLLYYLRFVARLASKRVGLN